MNRLMLYACIALIGCGEGGGPLLDTPQVPAEGCEFSSDSPVQLRPIVIDVAESTHLRLPLVVHNPTNQPLKVDAADVAWTCHETGFSRGGPLIVPDLSANRRFCQGSPDNGDFVGFNVLSVSGAAIPPGERGIVYVELVPDALGIAFDAMFTAAVAAHQCVASAGTPDPRDEDCADAFAVSHLVSDQEILILAQFAVYDGRFFDEVIGPRGGTSLPDLGASYPMKVQGTLFHGSAGSGTDVGRFEVNVELCRSCGLRTAEGRQPREGWRCYHE